MFRQVPYKPGFTLFAQRHSTTSQKTWFFCTRQSCWMEFRIGKIHIGLESFRCAGCLRKVTSSLRKVIYCSLLCKFQILVNNFNVIYNFENSVCMCYSHICRRTHRTLALIRRRSLLLHHPHVLRTQYLRMRKGHDCYRNYYRARILMICKQQIG